MTSVPYYEPLPSAGAPQSGGAPSAGASGSSFLPLGGTGGSPAPEGGASATGGQGEATAGQAGSGSSGAPAEGTGGQSSGGSPEGGQASAGTGGKASAGSGGMGEPEPDPHANPRPRPCDGPWWMCGGKCGDGICQGAEIWDVTTSVVGAPAPTFRTDCPEDCSGSPFKPPLDTGDAWVMGPGTSMGGVCNVAGRIKLPEPFETCACGHPSTLQCSSNVYGHADVCPDKC